MKLNIWSIVALSICAAALALVAGTINLFMYPAEPNMFEIVPAGTFDLLVMPILAFLAVFFGLHTAVYVNERPSQFAKALILVGLIVAISGLCLIIYASEQDTGLTLGLEIARTAAIIAGIFGSVVGFVVVYRAKYIALDKVDYSQ